MRAHRTYRMLLSVLIAIAAALLFFVLIFKINVTGQPSGTPEQFAIKFWQALAEDHDEQLVDSMLCADGYATHRANVAMWIQQWTAPYIKVQPHDFQVARIIKLAPEFSGNNDEYKVWVAFSYTSHYGGKDIQIELNKNGDEGGTYITKLDQGYCASPWAGG